MKGIRFIIAARSFVKILSAVLLLSASAPDIYSQAAAEAAPAPNTAPNTPPATEKSNTTAAAADAVRARLVHARALAATGNFTAAVSELETARRDAREDSVRDVARVLLMSVHLKMGNYTRSRELLEEAFALRSANEGGGTNIYFALVGQMLNGVRSRLDRYREFGLSTADASLPVEAHNDLGHVRLLLERIVEQAKLIREENATNTDSAALVEDAASVRLLLVRNDGERTQWQNEVAEARQRLAASSTRVANNAPRNAAPPAASAPNTVSEKPAANILTSVPTDAGNTNGTAAAAPAPNATPGRTADSPAAKTPPSSAPTSAPSTPSPARPAPQPDATSNGDATAPAAPVSIGSLHDKATQRVSPTYPPIARTARVSGVVTVYLLVDEKGAVESIERTSGPAQLHGAATDAARRWKFRPTVVGGQPVRVAGYLSFSFTL